MRHIAFAAALTLALGAVVSVPAAAQDIPGQPSAKRGEDIAQKLCAFCHLPQPGAPRLQGTADVPTFPEIAKRPGFDADRVANTVMAPPHPMPPVPLTKPEMADVAAYIATLK